MECPLYHHDLLLSSGDEHRLQKVTEVLALAQLVDVHLYLYSRAAIVWV